MPRVACLDLASRLRMMRDTHPLIAREGWPHVLIALGLALLATWLVGWWSIPFWLIPVFVVQFFRDPHRAILQTPGVALSPADGRVVLVSKARDPYLEREALKISVFMNVFDVHSNRSPLDAEVKRTWYNAGRFLNAALDKASVENERAALHLRTDEGTDVTCVQIAGLVARRILCYAKEGDQLARGQRYGFIRFGSRVDVYLPPSASPQVSVGDTVTAGTSVLASLCLNRRDAESAENRLPVVAEGGRAYWLGAPNRAGPELAPYGLHR